MTSGPGGPGGPTRPGGSGPGGSGPGGSGPGGSGPVRRIGERALPVGLPGTAEVADGHTGASRVERTAGGAARAA